MTLYKKYLEPYKKQLIIGPLFKWIEALLELFLPTFMALLVDNGIAKNDLSYIKKMGLLMIGCIVVAFASSITCQYNASIASQGFGTKLRNDFFAKINSLSVSKCSDFGSATLTNRLNNDINSLQLSVAMLIRLVVRAPFLCIGGFVMAARINFTLSLIVLVAMILFVIIISIIIKKSIPLNSTVQTENDELTAIVSENLAGVRVVRALNKSDHEEKRYLERNNKATQAIKKLESLNLILNPLTMLVMNIAIVIVLWFSGRIANAGNISSGEIIAFMNYLALILQALIVVSTLVTLFNRAIAGEKRVSEIFAVPSDESLSVQVNTDTNLNININTKNKLELKSEHILEFKNVTFKHADADLPIISDVSFNLKKGERLGIIGGTGSGKTTLLDLIARFYDIDSGEIIFDNMNIDDLDKNELRSNIGYILQRSRLVRATIKDNIRWGKDGANDEEILEAAQVAQAMEFIQETVKGFDTLVEFGSSNLSGGQRQRLCIARALVRKPKLLIMDNATSALDFETESKFRNNLDFFSQKYGITIIETAQRIMSVRNAEKIIVLEDGKITGTGDHESLLKSNEFYAELSRSQTQI